MKFHFTAGPMAKVIKAVAGARSRSVSTPPICSHLLLAIGSDGSTLTATDISSMQATTAAPVVGEPGAVTLPAKKFLDICLALPPGAEVNAAPGKDGHMVMKSGRSRFTLATMSPEDFPSMEPPAGRTMEWSAIVLHGLVSGVQYAMAKNDVRTYLNGQHWMADGGFLRVVATDGHRLSINSVACAPDDAFEIIVPRASIPEIIKVLADQETAQLTVSADKIMVKSGGLTLVVVALSGRYPDISRVAPDPSKALLVTVSTEVLRNATHQALIVAGEMRNPSVEIEMVEPGTMRITAEAERGDTGAIEVPVVGGGELTICMNPAYLSDALEAIEGDEVHLLFGDNGDPNVALTVLEDGGTSKHILMPLRCGARANAG